MDKVIAEVIIGILFLGLVLTMIPVYRSNAEIAAEAVEIADFNEKIKKVTGPVLLNNTWVTGDDVIDAIRYYGLSGLAAVHVTGQNGSKTYDGTDYDEESNIVITSKQYYCMFSGNGSKKFIIFYQGA